MKLVRAQNFKLLTRLVAEHPKLLLFGLGSLLIVSLINLSIPSLIKDFVGTIPQANSLTPALKFSAILIILFILQGLFGYFRILYFNQLGLSIITKMRKQIFDAIIAKKIQFFETAKTGDLISRLNTDTQLLQEVICSKLSVAIRYAVQVVGGIALMFFISFKLSLLIIVALPILVISSMFLAKKLKALSLQIQTNMGLASSLAEESFTGIRVIKVFPNQSLINNSFHQLINTINELSLKRSKISAFFQSFISFLLYSLIILFLLAGIYLANHQELDYPNLTAFVLYSILVAVSFSFLVATIDELTKGLAATKRILEILNDTEDSKQQTITVTSDSISSIEVQNLNFKYESRDQLVIKNLNFKLNVSTIYSLTGPSGVGKSTLINLILGFNNPTSGEIIFHGSRNLSSNVIDYISYVPQNPTIFDFSIKENLLLANNSATTEDLWDVLTHVRLAEFVNSLPEGLETICGSRGLELSGGQQQKLAIARALLKNVPILILDEATSALDSDSEANILNYLQSIKSSKIILLVSHRLSAIKACDQLLLLNYDQRIIAGTHEEMIQKSDYYQFLINHQAV